ncbi:MAG: T9SS type A sorting domain-containing protein [Ignavibacteriales bacterium]|nr:T9SS type A sorting domain-containing protein [Ignavibacteriales bacterium]
MRKSLIIIAFYSNVLFAQSGWNQIGTMSDNVNTIFFTDSLTGWIGGYTNLPGNNGVIRKTTDGGFSWTQQMFPDSNSIFKIKFLNSSTGFAVGGNGLILKTTNGGTDWIKKNSPTSSGIGSVFFLDNQNGWACGTQTIIKTTDQGENWTLLTTDSTVIAITDISFGSLTSGWCVGLYGKHIKTTDGGSSWIPTSFPSSDRSWYGIQYLSPSIAVAVGGGKIARTTNAGESWDIVWVQSGDQLNSVSFANSEIGWAVGSSKILKTTNGGVSWGAQQWGPYHYLSEVHCSDSLHAWAISSVGVFYKTTNGGVTSVENTLNGNDPTLLSLFQNYPNPFNPTTAINFLIPEREFVSLKIYDLLGKEIETLVNEEMKIGNYTAKWDATNLPSGMYFYRLTSGTFSETKKMILMK